MIEYIGRRAVGIVCGTRFYGVIVSHDPTSWRMVLRGDNGEERGFRSESVYLLD